MAQSYDTIAKVVLIGESGVGKSSLAYRFVTGEAQEHTTPTMGMDFHVIDCNYNGNIVKLQIWDTGGQERFYSLTNTYYRDMHGAFLVFDLNSQRSFERLKEKWFPDLCSIIGDQECSKLIIGNKTDLDQIVDQKEIDDFAKEEGLKFVRASAQEGHNVAQVMHMMVQNLMDRVFPALINPETKGEVPKTIRLDLTLKDENHATEEQRQKDLEESSSSICCRT